MNKYFVFLSIICLNFTIALKAEMGDMGMGTGASTDVPPPPPSGANPPPPPPSSTPPPPMPGATPVAGAPAVSDVPSTQMTWADAGAPELSEEKKGLTSSSDAALLKIFNDGNLVIKSMDDIMTAINTQYTAVSSKYFDADAQIDQVIQQASFSMGLLKQTTTIVESKAATPTTAAQPSASAENQINIKQINDQLEAIKTDKKQIHDLFVQLNDEMGRGKAIVNQARQKNLQVLSLQNAASAQAILGEVNQLQSNVKQMQESIKNSTIKSFNTTYDQLQGKISATNALMQKLQTKGFETEVAQEQKHLEKQPTPAAPTQAFAAWFIPEQATIPTASAGEATVVHYVLKKAADLITAAIQFVYETYSRIKNAIFGDATEKQALTKPAQQTPTVSGPQSANTPAASAPVATTPGTQAPVPGATTAVTPAPQAPAPLNQATPAMPQAMT